MNFDDFWWMNQPVWGLTPRLGDFKDQQNGRKHWSFGQNIDMMEFMHCYVMLCLYVLIEFDRSHFRRSLYDVTFRCELMAPRCNLENIIRAQTYRLVSLTWKSPSCQCARRAMRGVGCGVAFVLQNPKHPICFAQNSTGSVSRDISHEQLLETSFFPNA